MGQNKSKLAKHYNIEALKPKLNPIDVDYEISDKKLGSGISGSVFLCIDRVTKEEYALKTLLDNKKSRREIILHVRASLGCPYIVQIVDVYENIRNGKKIFYVVMECMKGGELFGKINERITKNKFFTEQEVAKMMFQICSAVKHIHDLGIAHRDLKPENLLLSSNDENAIIKLTDFGFAKETDLGLHTPCYTPYYVAPEVLGSSKYDNSCDIWSLGVILYILLAGYPPFFSRHNEAISPGMKKRIKTGDYTFPENEWSVISNEAKTLIKEMIVTIPEKRITIDGIMKKKWIYAYNEVPKNLIAAVEITVEDSEEIKNHIDRTLSEMRVDYDNVVVIKRIDDANNSLLKKRMERLNKINEKENISN